MSASADPRWLIITNTSLQFADDWSISDQRVEAEVDGVTKFIAVSDLIAVFRCDPDSLDYLKMQRPLLARLLW